MTKCAKCLEGLIIGWILVRLALTRPEHILESMWAVSKWCLTFFGFLWDGMGLTSGYGCRHRSKDYLKAHPLPY